VERKKTMRDGQMVKKNAQLDESCRLVRSKALKARTLGVPAGWNKPASRWVVMIPVERVQNPGDGKRTGLEFSVVTNR